MEDDLLKQLPALRGLLNILVEMTHDKLIFQYLFVRYAGEEHWLAAYQAAKADPRFLGENSLAMAELKRSRDIGHEIIRQLQAGEIPSIPTDSVN